MFIVTHTDDAVTERKTKPEKTIDFALFDRQMVLFDSLFTKTVLKMVKRTSSFLKVSSVELNGKMKMKFCQIANGLYCT